MSSHSIYGLFDPADPERKIRYIGYTSKTLEQRLRRHLIESKSKNACHRHAWINSLVKQDKRPGVVLIESVTPENWQERESFWISFYVKNDLVNSTTGGEGLINPSPEVRARLSEKTKGKNIGNQFRKGIPHTDLDRALISERLKSSAKKKLADDARRGKPGHKLSDDAKQKISVANRGRGRPDASLHAALLCEKNIGSFWVNDGNASKLMRKGQPIPDGWKIGRMRPSDETIKKYTESIRKAADKIYTPERNGKIASSRRGGKWINNGTINRYLKEGMSIPDGFDFGKLKRK